MRTGILAVTGAVAMAAMVTTGVLQAQAPEGAAGTPARYERRGPGGGFGHGGFGPGLGRGGFGSPLAMLRRLDLTDAQRTQIRQVMDGHRDELRAAGERLAAARKAQHAAVTSATLDEQAVRAASADLAQVMADAAVLRARVHSEVFAVLTPDQQAKAAELRAQREARRQQVRERVRQRMEQRRAAPPRNQ
jgi:Spy/CpxP family protein refolding chaperone